MSADTAPDTPTNGTPVAGLAGGSSSDGELVPGGIRPVRRMRGSAPISAELFTSTSNPLVIAFQTSAIFAADDDPDLTLGVLQQRWSTSRRSAAEARRALIDLGYWVGVRARMENGRWRTETRTWEVRLTEGDLADLAAQYAPTSQLDCGGRTYVVGMAGELCYADHDRRVAAGGHSVRPAETLPADAAELPLVVTRPDLGVVDNSPAELPPAVSRGEQDEQSRSAGRAELPPAVVPHASITFGDGYACMHDECLEFWAMIGRQVSTPIDRGGRKSVDDQLAVAWQAGWTPGALARWLTEQVAAARRLSNPAGFVIARLREIPAPADVAPSQREIDERRALEARRRAEDRARERDNCTMCDASGYIGRQVCDHDPNRIDRNRHGVALARRALADALAARREDTGSEPPAAPEGAETTGRAVG